MRLLQLLLVLTLIVAAAPASAAEKALCLVCSVTHGESEPEPVRATRTHEGKEYGFCSEKCAEAFDADPAAYIPPTFPRPAPAFAVDDLAGKKFSNEALRGRVTLVDFWATWCVPCRKSMPELQALHEKYAGRGLTVLGISIDEGGASKVKKYVTSKKLTYPIAIDSEKTPAWDAFRVKAVPAAFLIDREGRVVAQWTGASPKAADLEAALEKLLAAD